MKKYIPIILGCVIVAVITFSFLGDNTSKNTTDTLNGTTDQGVGTQTKPEEARKPADIKIALYDPAIEASVLTKLLEARLKSFGYQVSITQILPDPSQAQSIMTTLFLRSNLTASMATLQRTFLNSPVVRQIANDSFPEDILIATWNIEDITWGDMADEAQRIAMPDPSSVSMVVYNAGAKSGSAGTVADLLKAQGYTLAEAKNGDTTITGASIVYYQKGYKAASKKVLEILKANGYAERTYRARQDQEANIVIMLAGSE